MASRPEPDCYTAIIRATQQPQPEDQRQQHPVASSPLSWNEKRRRMPAATYAGRIRGLGFIGVKLRFQCAHRSLLLFRCLEQNENEDGGAHRSKDQGDRHFEGHDDDPGDNVAQHDRPHPHHADPGQIASQIIPPHHGDDVGNNQAQERNVADDRGHNPDGNGNQRVGKQNKPVVIDAQRRGDVFAQSGQRQAVGIQENQNGNHDDRPTNIHIGRFEPRRKNR